MTGCLDLRNKYNKSFIQKLYTTDVPNTGNVTDVTLINKIHARKSTESGSVCAVLLLAGRSRADSERIRDRIYNHCIVSLIGNWPSAVYQLGTTYNIGHQGQGLFCQSVSQPGSTKRECAYSEIIIPKGHSEEESI